MCHYVYMTATAIAAAGTSPGLRERKKAQTRRALQDAALELFVRQGFERTTVEEIAEACDVSPRTFFRYFPTKEDVLFADSQQRCAGLVEVLASQPPDLAPLPALHAAMRSVALGYRHERPVLLARTEIVQVSPNLRAYKAEHQRGWEESVVRELTRRADASASTISPLELRLVTSVSIGALRAALDTWLEDADAPDILVLLDQAFAHVSQGFGATEG
jgi:AcrR family transcriptional regulator